MFVLFVMRSYLIEVRGLKLYCLCNAKQQYQSYLIEVRGLKPYRHSTNPSECLVVSYRGTWVETCKSYEETCENLVVSYRGTWVET